MNEDKMAAIDKGIETYRKNLSKGRPVLQSRALQMRTKSFSAIKNAGMSGKAKVRVNAALLQAICDDYCFLSEAAMKAENEVISGD